MPRFVILRHETPPGSERPSHWDLMFERGPTLRTWALAEEPHAGACIPAESLPDHRLAYLDYEGPVSGQRGSVTRWDGGTYRLVAQSASEFVADVAGERLSGEVRLQRIDARGRAWTFTHAPS